MYHEEVLKPITPEIRIPYSLSHRCVHRPDHISVDSLLSGCDHHIYRERSSVRLDPGSQYGRLPHFATAFASRNGTYSVRVSSHHLSPTSDQGVAAERPL